MDFSTNSHVSFNSIGIFPDESKGSNIIEMENEGQGL